jgi:hypothetical protein
MKNNKPLFISDVLFLPVVKSNSAFIQWASKFIYRYLPLGFLYLASSMPDFIFELHHNCQWHLN